MTIIFQCFNYALSHSFVIEQNRSQNFKAMKLWTETYINQTKIVLIDWKLFRTNLFLQSWGIGALENQKQ